VVVLLTFFDDVEQIPFRTILHVKLCFVRSPAIIHIFDNVGMI
jgi:hypothetical protein